MHCRPLPNRGDVCDARHFWVSGYAGGECWSKVEPTRPRRSRRPEAGRERTVPFWDPALLALTTPRSSTDRGCRSGLRDQHGVRWLFADLTTADAAGLARVADLRYQAGDYAVYAVRTSS
jgi:hypothetical protein